MGTEVGRTAGTATTDRRGLAGILLASFLVKPGQDGQDVRVQATQTTTRL